MTIARNPNGTPKGKVEAATGEHPCDGTLRIHCCCPQLTTSTFTHDFGPQTEAQLLAAADSLLSAWEAAGYLVIAHSLVDTGAGWAMVITVGAYV